MTLHRRLSLLAVIVLALLSANLTLNAQSYTPTFEPAACPFPTPADVSCGTLIVPEDRANPGGQQLKLAVAIIAAQNGSPLPDPIIYLEGGPGGSAFFALEDYLRHPLRQNRDLILLDQRGTGFSQPSLNCWEMEEDGGSVDALAACYTRLTQSEGLNLDHYDSAANAADVNDLRIALGYQQVNLWGISYGTRLALTVMRDHPEGLRAVVIDSVFPPEVDDAAETVRNTTEAFDAFFAACAADPQCSSAYPTLEADFYAMIDAYNFNPPVFEYDDGEEIFDLELYGDSILDVLFSTLYNSSTYGMLPYGILLLSDPLDDFDYMDGYDILSGFWTVADWERGETGGFGDSVYESDMVLNYLDEYGDISDSEGMYHAVECAEEVPFNNLDAAYAAADAAPDVLSEWLAITVEQPFFDCERFPVAANDAIESQRVQSNLPVLLISGGLDPVTPPRYADSALLGLTNGQHVVFPLGGHGESGSVGCGANIARAFFDNPGAPPNTACIPRTIDWYLE